MFHNRRKRRFCLLPGYNWCGPNCSRPGKPVNELDAACKEHDECYCVLGNRCQCDCEYLERLEPLLNERTEQGKHARIVYNYMKMQKFFHCNF